MSNIELISYILVGLINIFNNIYHGSIKEKEKE